MEKLDFEVAIYKVICDAENVLELEEFIKMLETLGEEFYSIANSTKQNNWRR